MRHETILSFWFSEIEPKQWWQVDAAFDQQVKSRFLATLEQAARGELAHWRGEPRGRLAEVIVLDQFSRHIYRGTAGAFAQDGMALVLGQEAIAAGVDQQLSPAERAFLYMPFMHSESKLIHLQAEQLFRQPGLERNYDFELRHKAIIDRFGRYPHRNAVLGRESSPQELAFLQQPGSSF